MATLTHYAALGVTPSAELQVIRAAFKALVLIHHPDKTVHLSAEARAEHSALFRQIQEAWDVLGTPSLKAAYDRELERHGNRIDVHRSTFHRPSTPATTSRPHCSIQLTSPEQKRATKAKIEQDLAYLREQRAKRDIEDSKMDIAGLTFMLQIWTDMAAENSDDVNGNGHLRAYCAVQIQVYQAKIARREQEHEEWLEGMSRPKAPGTPGWKSTTPLRSSTSTPNRFRTTAASKPTPRTAPVKPRTNAPLSSRAEDKARMEAAKQAHLHAKAAAVRAEKAKQKARIEDQARRESERVARVRAKAGAPPLGRWGAGGNASSYQGSDAGKPGVKKMCNKCRVEHASFAEWRRCAKANAGRDEEEAFFHTL